MFMSSTFHCIKAHSHPVSKFGNQLDYFGIVILITCSLISIILFAYYDYPWYRNILLDYHCFRDRMYGFNIGSEIFNK